MKNDSCHSGTDKAEEDSERNDQSKFLANTVSPKEASRRILAQKVEIKRKQLQFGYG